MCIWIIHYWGSWLHCIICTSGWNPLPLHHNFNGIFRRTNDFCLGNLQCLSEYHFTQPRRKILSKFTISIPGVVKKKTAKTFISLRKPEGTIHSVKRINPRKKPAGKIWYELLEPIFIIVKIIRSYSDHVVFLWV